MSPIVDGVLPDLVFYYSFLLDSTIVSQTDNGGDQFQTSTGIIFADINLQIPIGSFAFDITIFNIDKKSDASTLYDGTGTNVYFLPQGTLYNSIDIQFIKNSEGQFVVPFDDEPYVYQILSGSGDFLNSRGIIVQVTDPNLGRQIQVYFEK